MIDAKELRIGNWIEAVANMGNYPMKFTEHNFVDLIKNPDCANPIPLTTEILLKCGFELAHTNATYFIHDDMTGDFVPRKDGFYLEDYEGQDITNLPIKYIHQLQNLYFALTQKELEIKL